MEVNRIAGADVYKAATQVQSAGESRMMEQATDAADTAVIKKPVATSQEMQCQTGDNKSSNGREEMSQEKIKKAIDTINKQLSHTECQYGFHEKTNRVMIKIVDKDTDKVIKEFPPEETLEMIAKAWELAGILVDEKL